MIASKADTGYLHGLSLARVSNAMNINRQKLYCIYVLNEMAEHAAKAHRE
jgi:hypothetical protein